METLLHMIKMFGLVIHQLIFLRMEHLISMEIMPPFAKVLDIVCKQHQTLPAVSVVTHGIPYRGPHLLQTLLC